MTQATDATTAQANRIETDPVGTGSRVMREIIRTPAFRRILQLHLTGIDPGAARDTVRVLMNEDPDLSLSLLGASPAAIQYLIEALLETARQVRRFPPQMLDAYLDQVTQQIDADRLREIPETLGPLLERMLLENPERRRKMMAGFTHSLNAFLRGAASMMERMEQADADDPVDAAANLDVKALGQIVTLGARRINRSLDRDPALLRDMAAGVDAREVVRAAVRIGWTLVAAVIACPFRALAAWWRKKKTGGKNRA